MTKSVFRLVLVLVVVVQSQSTAQEPSTLTLLTNGVAKALRKHDKRIVQNSAQNRTLARELAKLTLAPCHVEHWLNSRIYSPSRNPFDFLMDKLDDHRQRITDIAGQLRRRFIADGVPDSAVSSELRALAMRIAANEESDSHILNEVIPKLANSIRQLQQRYQSELEVLRRANLEYTSSAKSFCQRMDEHKRILDAHNSKLEALDSKIAGIQSQIEQSPIIPRVDSLFSNSDAIRPAGFTATSDRKFDVYPDVILHDMSSLCSTAKLLKRCYNCSFVEKYNGRSRRVSHHGNVYQDCGGRIVLVTHPIR